MILETKLDDTFPIDQSTLEGFASPFRIDRKLKGSGILLPIREGITIKLISPENSMSKKKWNVYCSYNADKSSTSVHLQVTRQIMVIYSSFF